MKQNPTSQSGLFNPRVLLAFALCSVGSLLAMLSFAAAQPDGMTRSALRSPGDLALLGKQAGSLNGNASGIVGSRPVNSAGAGSWAIVPSPNTTSNETSFLTAITCVSASDYWAVGYSYSVSITYQTLVEHWDGSSWSTVASPNVTPNSGIFLSGVACASTSDCWTVGYYYDNFGVVRTLTEHWDGTSWAMVNSPNTAADQNNVLLGATCASTSDCWAVGTYFNSSTYQTLIEHWNGASWTIVTSANTSTTQLNKLYGVTCASASECWAVGYWIDPLTGIADQTLIERWDGTSWSIVTSANTSVAQTNVLVGVTCASLSDCWAVGYSSTDGIADQTLIERWDGSSWTIVISANSSALQNNNVLYGATCTSTSDCWAVGYYNSPNSPSQTLIEHWNGSAWAVVTSPDTSAADSNSLEAVACWAANGCWAVGVYSVPNAVAAAQTLIERWDGTSWVIVTSPNTIAPQNNFLYGVTCVSATNCWAVGDSLIGSAYQTLIEHWDGTSWIVVPSPSPLTGTLATNILYSATCASASDCWAVGVYGGTGAYQTLIEHWDGASWTIITSPNTSAAQNNFLSAVTCASSSDCWAAGEASPGGSVYQTLIEHWNGSSWAIVASPNANATQYNFLNSVTCTSASDCWAVGDASAGTAAQNAILQTLTEHWDGTSWTVVTSPNTASTQNNQLDGVTCASASACWAVGYYNSSSGAQTLIERWDGASWAITNSPNTSATQGNALNAVACASASNCWGVGYYYNGAALQTLIEQWSGTSWNIVTSPNTDNTHTNLLQSVVCASASDCVAVGFYDAGGQRTLVEHYGTIGPVPTSVVSRKTHGTAGDFDIDLPLAGNPGIECRNFQDTNSGRHQIVITFAAPVTVNGSQNPKATLTAPKGGSVDTVDVNNSVVTVNLKDAGNEQTINITLLNVSDGTNSGNVSIPMGVLVGDTSGNGLVNSTDVSQTQAQSGQAVTGSNFRTDVNANGLINSTDVSLVQSKSGTGLP